MNSVYDIPAIILLAGWLNEFGTPEGVRDKAALRSEVLQVGMPGRDEKRLGIDSFS